MIEVPGFGLMHQGHEVPVAVERRLDRRMAQLSLDVLRMSPLGDGSGSLPSPHFLKK